VRIKTKSACEIVSLTSEKKAGAIAKNPQSVQISVKFGDLGEIRTKFSVVEYALFGMLRRQRHSIKSISKCQLQMQTKQTGGAICKEH